MSIAQERLRFWAEGCVVVNDCNYGPVSGIVMLWRGQTHLGVRDVTLVRNEGPVGLLLLETRAPSYRSGFVDSWRL